MPPVYEHKCETCGSKQEEIYSIHDSPEIKCKECGELTRRVIGASAFILQNGGWFRDGY